ncbi:hypothetical protein [Cupriavidus consociatus]|uniref:hypothetical protein n=1 Tax=Cupriavidus consociatus TaxID=2821357 RepID=UPI001AE9BA24|nr:MULTISPECIES: hypothetical protein [unclassified Cupriavidus]MBP0623615.1 hypothetical protein [Cupriavidus sp. LEh25]MDK2660318.1 hypothetical protein [Cupriavidus sp. LEh21]
MMRSTPSTGPDAPPFAMHRLMRRWLCVPLFIAGASVSAQDLVECKRIEHDQLIAATQETLLFLRCRARHVAYEAPRLKGVSQRFKDDLIFACLDQADAVEHQLRVRHGYSREALARQRCTSPDGAPG